MILLITFCAYTSAQSSAYLFRNGLADVLIILLFSYNPSAALFCHAWYPGRVTVTGLITWDPGFPLVLSNGGHWHWQMSWWEKRELGTPFLYLSHLVLTGLRSDSDWVPWCTFFPFSCMFGSLQSLPYPLCCRGECLPHAASLWMLYHVWALFPMTTLP